MGKSLYGDSSLIYSMIDVLLGDRRGSSVVRVGPAHDHQWHRPRMIEVFLKIRTRHLNR